MAYIMGGTRETARPLTRPSPPQEASIHNRVLSKFATGAVIVLLTAGLAIGQAGRGAARLSGSVVDKDGKPVPGARIAAVFDQAGGSSFVTVTDKKGEWGFVGVGTGPWIVTASQIKPDWPDPYYRISLAYLNKADNAKAAENLEKLIKLEPETERTARAILEAIKK